jgi:hypothetical protein
LRAVAFGPGFLSAHPRRWRRAISFMKPEQKNGHNTKRTIVRKSNHAVVDRIYELEKEDHQPGHYIPESWHHFIVDKRGQPYYTAIFVFGEIYFRHRPVPKVDWDKDGNKVITLMKAFKLDRYQWNRAEISKRLNISKKAVSTALTYLSSATLKLVNREEEDTQINYRGFRKMVYVTPNLDRLLELNADVVEKVNNSEQQEERDNPDVGSDSLRRGVDVVTTSGPSRNDVGSIPGSVSTTSSNKTSHSASRSATPNASSESKNNNNTSAPQGAQAGGDVLPDNWEAPPPKPSGKDSKFKTIEEMVKTIRYHIGTSYLVWYEKKPDSSAKEFEDLLAEVYPELNWSTGDLITVIRAGWLWAVDAPKQEPDKTFIPGLFSKKCKSNLRALFQRDRKLKKPFLWHIRQELETQAQNEYKIELGSMSLAGAEDWWKEELLNRSVIRDENKFYSEAEREICNPVETTWVAIKRVFENWIDFRKQDWKPEPKWLEAVVERLKTEPGEPSIHREFREKVEQYLKSLNLIPA